MAKSREVELLLMEIDRQRAQGPGSGVVEGVVCASAAGEAAPAPEAVDAPFQVPVAVVKEVMLADPASGHRMAVQGVDPRGRGGGSLGAPVSHSENSGSVDSRPPPPRPVRPAILTARSPFGSIIGSG